MDSTKHPLAALNAIIHKVFADSFILCVDLFNSTFDRFYSKYLKNEEIDGIWHAMSLGGFSMHLSYQKGFRKKYKKLRAELTSIQEKHTPKNNVL